MAYRKTTIEPPDYTYIPGGLKVGAQIIVRGRVTQDGETFSINLQNEQSDGSDIAFHFNPRPEAQSVVRNSYQGGWQDEELSIPSFPFTNGSKFTVRIYVAPDSYVVLVNGQNFISFKHRLPFKSVQYLNLSKGAEYYESTIQNPCRTPYKGELPGGLKTGKALRVRGFVNEDANRFEINFNTDREGEVVAVLFNPRQDQNDVVLNTKDGSWQKEERGQEWFPFPRGQYFDVLFIASNDKLNIYVSEKYFTSYVFRIPPEKILYLDIHGDVTLKDVEFEDPLPSDHIKVIPSGLVENDLIVTRGFFYPEGSRFSINLVYGTTFSDDIALHFNPRRDQNEVVLNSRDNGQWQKEERYPLPPVFVEMIPFKVEIVNKTKKFKIYVNGLKFASFQARGLVENIRSINVGGEAYVHEVQVLSRKKNPHVDRLPNPLETGSWITVTGTPKKNADGFAIYLQSGDSPDGDGDVAFVINPRFKEETSVRNTKENGSWGTEEREQPNFPFKPEDRFEISIVTLPKVFKVFVNQNFYVDYAHRIDPSRIGYILLTGDCNFFEPEFY